MPTLHAVVSRRKMLARALVAMLIVLMLLPSTPARARTAEPARDHEESFLAKAYARATGFLSGLFAQEALPVDPNALVRAIGLCRRDYPLYVGETYTIVPAPLGLENLPLSNVNMTFTSDNPAVAEVTSWGEIDAIAPGTATVRVQAGLVYVDVTVEVSPGTRPIISDQEWDARFALNCPTSMIAGATGTAASDGEGAPTGSAGDDSSVGDEVAVPSPDVEAEGITADAKGLPGGGVSATSSIGEDGADPTTDEATTAENEVGSPRYSAVQIASGSATRAKENMGSANYSFAAPVLSLPGRESSVDLALVYNSQLWEKDTSGSTVTMNFNYSKGWPAPGWRLGYGRIIQNYDNTRTGLGTGLVKDTQNPGNNLLVTADGTRIVLEAKWDDIANVYKVESIDGQNIRFNYTANKLKYPDGTLVEYNVGANNRLLPVTIQSPNGNLIRILYKEYDSTTFPLRQAIDKIYDSLNRYVEFNYDATTHNLTSITAPAFNSSTARRTLVQLEYQDITFNYSFTSGYVVNAPTAGSAITVLKRITYPDTGMGYVFSDYSTYGMIRTVSVRKGMIGSTGSLGTEIAHSSYNYVASVSAQGGTPLTKAPRYTTRSEWWSGKTDDATGAATSTESVYTYSSSSTGTTQTVTLAYPTNALTGETLYEQTEISTADDATQERAKNTVSTVSLYRGNPSSGGVLMRKVASKYGSFAGVQRTSVVTTNEADESSKVVTSYSRDFGRVESVAEYANKDDAKPVRTTNYTYLDEHQDDHDSYTSTPQWMGNQLHLVKHAAVVDGDGNLMARTDYEYDVTALMPYTTNLPDAQTRNASYDAQVSARGNLTRTIEYTDASDLMDTAKQNVHDMTYDIYGNLLTAEVNCCNEQTYVYTGGISGLYYAFPTQVTKGPSGIQLTSSTAYDFYTSVVTSETAPNGKSTSYGYDAAMRLISVTYPYIGTDTATLTLGFTRTGSNDELDYKATTTYKDYTSSGSVTRTVTNRQWLDGAGHKIRTAERSDSPVTNWDAVQMRYDAFGRPLARSNPYSSSASDASGTAQGWTTTSYDVLSRATMVTLQDSATVTTTFNGRIVTTTDPVGRMRQTLVDGLGRLVKVLEEDPSTGTLGPWVTDYTYDALDNLTVTKQYTSGSATVAQQRSASYDAASRLTSRTTPEGLTENYTYYAWGGVHTHTDARGVVATYTYDALNRLDLVQYTTSGTTAAATTSVDPSYATSGGGIGQVASVIDYSDGVNTNGTSYIYDALGRVSTMTRTIQARSYTTTYTYNAIGQVVTTQYPAPSNRVVRTTYDSRGRTVGVSNNASGGAQYVSSVVYNPAGQVTGLAFANGTTESFTYSSTSRMQLTGQTVMNGSTELMRLGYDYDAAAEESGKNTTAGNSGQLMGITPDSHVDMTDASQTFTYDTVGRLVTETGTNAATGGGSSACSAAPGAPGTASPTANSSSQITVTWTASSTTGANAPTATVLERKLSSDSTWGVVNQFISGTATSYIDTTVGGGNTYDYRVKVRNACGDSGYGATGSATTPPGACTAAPAYPNAVGASATSSTSVNFHWSQPSTGSNNPTSYTVERAPQATGPWTTLTSTLAAPATSYVDTSASAYTWYYYRVTAVNACGATPGASLAHVHTPSSSGCTQNPLGAAMFRATTVSSTQVNLTWTDQTLDTLNNETSYTIERSVSGSGVWTTLTSTLAADSSSYSDTTLSVTQPTAYLYRIRTQNECGSSGYGTSNTVTVGDGNDWSLQFNGSTNYLVSGSSQNELKPGTAQTVEAWIKPSRLSHTAKQVVVSRHGDAPTHGGQGYELRITTANTVEFAVYGETGTQVGVVTSDATLTANTWQHVAGGYSSTKLFVAVDGTYKEISSTAAVSATGTPLLYVARSNDSNPKLPYQGKVDELRISSIARYTVNFVPSQTYAADSSSLAMYEMNANAGTTVVDTGGSTNNALTLTPSSTGAPIWTTGVTTTFKAGEGRHGRRRHGGSADEQGGVGDAGEHGRSATKGSEASGTDAEESTTGAWQRRYVYDRWGNRTGVYDATSGGSSLQQVSLKDDNADGVPDSNRISSVTGVGAGTYSYDAGGNIASDGVTTYTYDGESRLVTAANLAGTSTYAYDESSHRTLKQAGGLTTHFVWDGDHVILECNGATGALISEYIYSGSRLIARLSSSGTEYYFSDRLSTRLILDGGGAVLGTQANFAFTSGAGTTGSFADGHLFTSYQKDTETGTDYALNRSYSGLLARFLSPDPVSGKTLFPQSLNRYAYSANDPINFEDPSGLNYTECVTLTYHLGGGDGFSIGVLEETSCYFVTVPVAGGDFDGSSFDAGGAGQAFTSSDDKLPVGDTPDCDNPFLSCKEMGEIIAELLKTVRRRRVELDPESDSYNSHIPPYVFQKNALNKCLSKFKDRGCGDGDLPRGVEWSAVEYEAAAKAPKPKTAREAVRRGIAVPVVVGGASICVVCPLCCAAALPEILPSLLRGLP